ncbi:MAG: ABC transporter permease, partial [Oscillospiraceae bacterium]|nr:ABC transporter permease [Oscillospiraceae bacterium]
MKKGFYRKLALQGIRKNKRLYTPYILTCTGMVMMYYIVYFLTVSDVVQEIPGGGPMITMLSLGSGVLAFFAALFLFYTNS